MKRVSFIVALFGLLVMSSCGATSGVARSETDKANAEVVASMLTNRLYKMDFNRGYPTAGPSLPLNYPYFVSIIRDRVESFLPYFGRAYNIPYGGGEGLRFTAPIENYKMTQGRKEQQIVTFDARTAEDSYQFRIEIYPTGETYLTVGASQKQAMSFSGQVDLDAKFEAIRITE
jgi:hypothetical protein